MIITKCAKRLMATVLTTALALSGFVAAPKMVSASEGTPTVEVKGATLRLDGTANGTQSMRIGVAVKKADLAAACGMKIEYKGKSATIATDTGYDKIYDYDENHQTVVYTAVIKDIPSTAFADDFTITGLVKGLDDKDYTNSASSATKSIDGIVESLGADYKLAEGTLVKKMDELDINNPKDGIYAWEQTIKDNGCASEVVTYKDVSCLKVSDGSRTNDKNETVDVSAAVKFKFSEKNSVGRKFYVDVNACSESGYKITSYSPETNKASATDFTQTGVFITGNGAYGYEAFTVAPTKAGDDLYVKSFAVYEAVSSLGYDDMEIDRGFVTLSAANEAISAQANTYADGKATVTLSKNYGGLGLAYYIKPAKVDLSQYSKVTFNITSESDWPICVNLLNDISGNDYWGRLNGSKQGKVSYYPSIKAGTSDYTYEISNIKGDLTEAQAIFIKYNPPAKEENETDESYSARVQNATFTINSIRFE